MNRIRPTSRALLGALVSGALATGALSGSAPANADCFSIFGLGNGNGCISNTTTYAIAIGAGAEASATGLFGGSLAIGDNAKATMSPFNLSSFNFATAIGNNATAQGYVSLFGIALQFGPGTAATLGFLDLAVGVNQGPGQAAVSGIGGIAMQLGPGSSNNIGAFSIALGLGGGTDTAGFGDFALNLLGKSVVTAGGNLNAAVNLLGNDNRVAVGGSPNAVLNLAIAAFGKGNTVVAGPGPLAFAGSILQTGATVRKIGTGFNINGLAVPGVASVPRSAAKPKAATAVNSAAKTPAPAAAGDRGRNANRVRERPQRAGSA
jgi:hypothetical protein